MAALGNRSVEADIRFCTASGQLSTLSGLEHAPRRGGFRPKLGCSASRRLTSGQHPGDDVSRVEQDGFVLLRRDLDEA
jgi:hypothetical protein